MSKKVDSFDTLLYFTKLVYYYARQIDKAETSNDRIRRANAIYSGAQAIMRAAEEIRRTVYREEGVYDHGPKKNDK